MSHVIDRGIIHTSPLNAVGSIQGLVGKGRKAEGMFRGTISLNTRIQGTLLAAGDRCPLIL